MLGSLHRMFLKLPLAQMRCFFQSWTQPFSFQGAVGLPVLPLRGPQTSGVVHPPHSHQEPLVPPYTGPLAGHAGLRPPAPQEPQGEAGGGKTTGGCSARGRSPVGGGAGRITAPLPPPTPVRASALAALGKGLCCRQLVPQSFSLLSPEPHGSGRGLIANGPNLSEAFMFPSGFAPGPSAQFPQNWGKKIRSSCIQNRTIPALTSWKRRNYGLRQKIRGCQESGWGRTEGLGQ